MTMRSAIFLLLAVSPMFAGEWSGYLVDSKCYGAELRNVNPMDAMPQADTDMSFNLRYCAVKPKTKDFAIVLPDWSRLRLDPAGNAKAAGLARQGGGKRFLKVDVKGEWNDGLIKVESISAAGTR